MKIKTCKVCGREITDDYKSKCTLKMPKRFIDNHGAWYATYKYYLCIDCTNKILEEIDKRIRFDD